MRFFRIFAKFWDFSDFWKFWYFLDFWKFWKFDDFFFSDQLFFFSTNFFIYFLLPSTKIFLDESSRKKCFELSFMSKHYFFALTIHFMTHYTKWMKTWHIFVTHFRPDTHPTFSIYKSKIYIAATWMTCVRTWLQRWQNQRPSRTDVFQTWGEGAAERGNNALV